MTQNLTVKKRRAVKCDERKIGYFKSPLFPSCDRVDQSSPKCLPEVTTLQFHRSYQELRIVTMIVVSKTYFQFCITTTG